MKSSRETKRIVPTNWLYLKEASEYLRMSYTKAKIDWPSWEKYGVHASRMGRKVLFNIKELDRMLELNRVN